MDGPDGAPWEVYTVLADSDVPADCCGTLRSTEPDTAEVASRLRLRVSPTAAGSVQG